MKSWKLRRRHALLATLTAPLVPWFPWLTAPAHAADAGPAPSPAAPTGTLNLGPEVEVKRLLDQQAREWSSGDIEGFCGHYHKEALFLSPTGLTQGRQAVLDRYRKKYATRDLMGTLSFDVLDVVCSSGAAGGDTASVAMRWRLTFEKRPSSEGFSVIGLVKADAKSPWLIKHDGSM